MRREREKEKVRHSKERGDKFKEIFKQIREREEEEQLG